MQGRCGGDGSADRTRHGRPVTARRRRPGRADPDRHLRARLHPCQPAGPASGFRLRDRPAAAGLGRHADDRRPLTRDGNDHGGLLHGRGDDPDRLPDREGAHPSGPEGVLRLPEPVCRRCTRPALNRGGDDLHPGAGGARPADRCAHLQRAAPVLRRRRQGAAGHRRRDPALQRHRRSGRGGACRGRTAPASHARRGPARRVGEGRHAEGAAWRPCRSCWHALRSPVRISSLRSRRASRRPSSARRRSGATRPGD